MTSGNEQRLGKASGRSRRLLALVVGLIAALALVVSGATPASAQNVVGPQPVNSILSVGPHGTAGQENVGVRGPPQLRHASAIGVAAQAAGDEAGDLAASCANSLTADTPVTLANGSQEPISKVKVGDKVLATGPQTGVTKAEPVAALIRHSGEHAMVLVTLVDGSVLDATSGHPIWDATQHIFVDASGLHVGDEIETDTGALMTVTALTEYSANLTAYNLQISTIHTYYAGATPVLVHNSCEDAVSYGLQQNQLDHVFVPKHNLAGLVSDAGGEQQAMTQIIQSVGNVPDGVYGPSNQLVRQVGNYSVTIRGAMINGTFKIGTAFIP